MKKEVIIHIGAAKCGSTAIQDFFDLNHARLRNHGVLMPGMDMTIDGPVHGNHIVFFEQGINGQISASSVQERINGIIDSMNAKSISKIIISAENLSNHPSIVAFLADDEKVDVTVVFYVRRQDDYIISYWHQWGLKIFDSFADYLNVAVGEIGDWNRTIKPWDAVFGRNRIRVRPFRRDRLHRGDIVADFCETVGIDCPDCTNIGIDVNPSMNENLGEMANRIRDVFKDVHDNDFLDVMSDLIGSHAFKSGHQSFLMDVEQRLEIYRKYFDGNEELKRRHLPDWGDAPLFAPPSIADCSSPSDVEKLRAESALLLRAVFGLARQLRTGTPELAVPEVAKSVGGSAPPAAGGGRDAKGRRRVDANGPWARQLTKKIRKAGKLLWPGH